MEVVDVLSRISGGKKYRRTSNGYAGPAPHRQDRHNSFSVFRSASGEWLVHDFAQPLMNGKHTMPLSLYLKEYFGEGGERIERPRNEPRTQSQVYDHYAEAEAALNGLSAALRTYRGHGFHVFEQPPEDIFELSRDSGKLKQTTAIMIYRAPDGRPWGIQARAVRDGRRAYWWHTRPKMPVSFSKDWDKANVLVVAEGLPKAAMMAMLVEDELNDYIDSVARKNGWTKWERKKVGYIALGGKSQLPNILEYVMAFPRHVVVLLDNDVEKEVVNPKTKDPVALAVKDLYYTRAGASLRTSLVGQPNGEDINDLIFEVGRHDALRALHPVQPRVNENSVSRHLLPAVVGLKQAESALLNALWAYALIKQRLRWAGRAGYIADIDPTYSNLMALSGLHLQTIKTAKASLLKRGVISKHDDGSLRLHLKRVRKFFPKIDDDSDTSSTTTNSSSMSFNSSFFLLLKKGRSLVVVKLPTPSNRAQSRLGRLSLIGSYRRSRHSNYGSTGVVHVLAFMLARFGVNYSAIARMLSINRKTVANAVKRVWFSLRNMAGAFNEFKERFMRVMTAKIEHILRVQQRAVYFVQTGDMDYYDDYVALLHINRRFARAQQYHPNANVNPFAVGLGG